ncbi:sensor histidine kinase [Pontibacillus yanchengensis]|nr:ATP-binding protein [Pontibacillus yanchengensis]
MRKWLTTLAPKGFLWKLTALNVMIITLFIVLSGLAMYNTACFLVESMGSLNNEKQVYFNSTLLQYLWLFSLIAILIGSIVHYLLTKKLVSPIKELIESTKSLKEGSYPDPIQVSSKDEMTEFVEHFNELIQQLKVNEYHRKKFVSDLSHELRTPLSNLNGYLNALQKGVINGDSSLYHSLYNESQRLTKMMNQLEQLKEWDYASYNTVAEKESVDISSLMNQCVSMFQWSLNEQQIEIEVNMSSRVLSLNIEGIQQVLTNLMDNAIRYYEGNSPIYISGTEKKDSYFISITGPGKSISEEQQQAIFERFFRTDPSRSRETGGSGLGLAITKEIIEHHNGEIGLQTDGDVHSFWISLPLR